MVDTDEIHCHYMYKRYPQVPNVGLLKELRWVNPNGEDIPQDDR